jgi:MFS family permease
MNTKNAFRFVILLGIVSLFADMTYEGGAAINGQFLALLGASAAVVSIAAGLGEFLGYALRSVSGYFADKTGKYWVLTFIGYGINLIAVPAMALAGSWQIAVLFILLERTGRAMRKPTVDAMLSYATSSVGKGWTYGLHTALDETGATLGPLIAALVLYLGGNYQSAYAWLAVSAALALGTLSLARITFPVPSRLEERNIETTDGFSRAYWLYMIAGAFFAMGVMSYELGAFYLATTGRISIVAIPLLLAFATGLGVFSNLALGKLYDRKALPTIIAAVVAAALFTPLLFAGNWWTLILAMIAWGVAYAIEDTILQAVIAGVIPEGKRNLAFGLFFVLYGLGWFIGSIAMGLLYSYSIPLLIAFAVAMPIVSLVFFVAARRAQDRSESVRTQITQ